MECVAHRVVDSADVVADRVVEVPDIRRRHRDVLGEAAVAIDADDFRVRANVCVAGAAEKTASVNDVTFGGDAITFLDVRHQAPDLGDVARELMADDKRRLASSSRPIVPVVDVDIGPADARAADADQDFVVPDLRFRNVPQNHPGSGGFLYESFHF
jgi:hypothetical protein